VVSGSNAQIAISGDASALAWLVTAGADALVDAAPRNWLAAPTPRPAPRSVAAPRPAARNTPIAAVRAAPELAAITDLAGLADALSALTHPLRRAGLAPRLVEGPVGAPLLVLGDQPEAAGSPADRLLGRMLAAIGLARDACGFAHLLPWPTPGGRPLRDDEISAFGPWLAHGLALAAPRLILTIGDRAAALTGAAGSVAALRGQWLTAAGAPALATFHPRRLLDQPELKRLAWADLQTLATRIQP